MSNPESQRIGMTLASLVSEGADAARVAEHVVAVWEQVEEVLTPIIGQGGVIALYKRSLHLVAPEHSWLVRLREADPPTVDAEALRSALAHQDPAAAAAGGGAMLRAFHELLASLVGPSLTGRLLADAWALPTSGPAAKGTSS